MRTMTILTTAMLTMAAPTNLQGVEYFWWLGPEEPIAAEDGRMWPLGAPRV